MKLTINRPNWSRGIPNNALLLDNGKMCCMGFYALACGLAKDQILNYSTFAILSNVVEIPEQAKWTLESPHHNSFDGQALMITNDKPGDLNREETITYTFAKHGVEVEFTDEEFQG